jgi:hypothetical protein
MTDESGQTYPYTIDTLLDNATGPAGYYGAFVANMHNDIALSPGADAIVASAQARGIPVVSARQMLDWLDSRNASAFSSPNWDGSTLSFSINAAPGAHGLVAMAPVADHQAVASMTYNGSPFTSFTMTTIKGIRYARFLAASGDYQINYTAEITPPDTSIITNPPDPSYQMSASFTFSATEAGSTFECQIDSGGFTACASPKPYSGLSSGQTHTFAVRATDLAGNTDPTPATYSWRIDIQAITFPPLPVEAWRCGLAPGAFASSGLPVSYASSNPAVATIVGGSIHVVSAGTTTITASQAGDGTYAPAVPVDRLLTVNSANLTVTADSKTKTYGASDPPLTYTVNGFVNGDTISIMTGTLTRSVRMLALMQSPGHSECGC